MRGLERRPWRKRKAGERGFWPARKLGGLAAAACLGLLASLVSCHSPCCYCGFHHQSCYCCCCCCCGPTTLPFSLASCGIFRQPFSTSPWGSKPLSSPQVSQDCHVAQAPDVLPPETVAKKSLVSEVVARAQRPQGGRSGSFSLPHPVPHHPKGSAGTEDFQGLLARPPL